MQNSPYIATLIEPCILLAHIAMVDYPSACIIKQTFADTHIICLMKLSTVSLVHILANYMVTYTYI